MISSKSDLAKYIENKRLNGQTTVYVILSRGLTVSADELMKLCPSSLIQVRSMVHDEQNIRVIYEALDYPGTKVANAYLSGNRSGLSQDELILYDIAVEIVNEAKKILPL